ncbi:Bromodomain-containing protein [Neocallimastix californiae]|uniref:Bromodomain-containing protein n=1 Tax=Neocallimastix californiae TaxID=1754190 RepID=A0A1Y2ANT6_9FUNG|nr:Bromodomain-containing protein [Neocallimastix californiae]|eukprot:ORY24146.1 Bromodomain-containing protein [Neocallimastix californiae]
MLRNPYSAAFKDPVPTTVPMYHEIIKKPMDFTTLKTNLDNKKYSTLKEFQSDVKLIFNNCYTFNMEGSDLFVAAQKLEVAFDELWERRHDLLRQATEKLAQKGYNVKHLKHRSSTLLVNNTADDDTVSNSKSKIKMSTGNDQNDDDAILKPQRNNSNITSSSSMVNSKSKQYSSIMKEKTSSTNYQSSDARNYRKGYKSIY